jgi:glycosyltransferase involved in cell wall biosynthesis
VVCQPAAKLTPLTSGCRSLHCLASGWVLFGDVSGRGTNVQDQSTGAPGMRGSSDPRRLGKLNTGAVARGACRREVDLVVLASGFPRLSETFVLNELLDLERRGLRLHIVALRRPEEVVQHEALRNLRAPVEYLGDGTPRSQRLAVRTAHAALLLRRGTSYLDGLADVVRAPDFTRTALGGAAVLAHRLLRLGSPPLYVHFAHKPGTYGRFAARLAGVPYALSAHAKDVWLTPPEELRAKARGAATVLTCTDEARSHINELAGGVTPVHRIYHGVEVPGSPGVTEGDGTPVILAVARLVEKKGLETLIRAAALLRLRGADFRVRIAGEGPEWARLQRLVHELGVADRVVFLGPLMEPEVRSEYGRAAVFALPCRVLENGDRDGLPNVVLEAMAHGLPVASTTLAGVREAVVDGECGLLVPPGDEFGLADALQRLLSDGALRSRLGAQARRRVVSRFERGANLPAVCAALGDGGLIPSPATRREAVSSATTRERAAA